MGCLTCEELKDRAYAIQINSKLAKHFTANPCVDCGESEIEVLLFSDENKVWSLIADRMPWPKVNAAIQTQEVLCANCFQRRIAARVGPWGIPMKRWET